MSPARHVDTLVRRCIDSVEHCVPISCRGFLNDVVHDFCRLGSTSYHPRPIGKFGEETNRVTRHQLNLFCVFALKSRFWLGVDRGLVDRGFRADRSMVTARADRFVCRSSNTASKIRSGPPQPSRFHFAVSFRTSITSDYPRQEDCRLPILHACRT